MSVPPEPLSVRRGQLPRDGGAAPDRLRDLALENERLSVELDLARRSGLAERQQHDDFLSYTAHELRTPLTLVLGYAQAIARRMRDRPEAARELADLERVIAATRRLSVMIDEMLDISRVETGRLKIGSHPFSLTAVAQEVIARAPAGRHIQLDGDPDLPEIIGDPARTGQALWILLRNALAVTPDDSPVRVELGASPGEVAVTVEDLGPTISDDVIPRLFELSHVYPTSVDRREGLGLGLFVARGIARALGGDVRAENAAGGARQGNRFTLTLPRSRPVQAPSASE